MPSLVVLHYTAMDTCKAALDRLCDPAAEVSAHYLISETGTVYHLIDISMRAWHAGAGQWGDISDVNSHSIGIELANTGKHPFPEPQMQALEDLLELLFARSALAASGVIAHSDMAPNRKSDPGPKFDWRRLALRGLSIWPEAVDKTIDFQEALHQFGYPADVSRETLLKVFRLRFRPWANGPLDAVDQRLATDLAQRFSFDRTVRTP